MRVYLINEKSYRQIPFEYRLVYSMQQYNVKAEFRIELKPNYQESTR